MSVRIHVFLLPNLHSQELYFTNDIDPHVNILLLGELFLECPSRELELADLNVQLVDDALVFARDVV